MLKEMVINVTDEISSGSGFSTYEERDKILVGFSGGVDSSVCVQILQEQGFDVYALFLRFSAAHDKHIQLAKDVAAQLNVPLTIHDCSEKFEKEIITNFCTEYCAGKTPSPCIICNPLVKFSAMESVANSMGINLIASGHYARVHEQDGVFYIKKGISEKKDQSYMLYRLPQSILSRLCLPIGEFEKDHIRDIAKSAELINANAPDSQEICFIPDNNYAQYIMQKGFESAKGRFIGPNGQDMGPHKGILHYTVGQRKGLNISYSEPLFVKRILKNANIELAVSGSEFFKEIDIIDTVSTTGKNFCVNDTFFAKIRSRALPEPCKITCVNKNTATVTFDTPQRAPAPGQSLVFYKGDDIMGGGVISDMR